MAISFFDIPKKFPVKKLLKEALKQTGLKSGFKIKQLNYIFVSDDDLLEINKKHLNHDYFTDIITFDLSEELNEIEGDIYISTERVEENGTKIGTGILDEYVRIIGHGFLHLIGYQDKQITDSENMRQAENNFINEYHRLMELP